MSLNGPLGFVLFWLAALAAGTLFVLLVVGGGFGWLALVGLPAIVLLVLGALRARPHRGR